MIGNMDIENAAFRINEEYLKDRIIESENVAAFSSHKVERMKDDLYALKLAMWFCMNVILSISLIEFRNDQKLKSKKSHF